MPETSSASLRVAHAPDMQSHHMLKVFGNNVRRLRLDAQISQEALAKRCTKYKNQITHIEDGTANVTLAMVYVLASALEVDPGTLLQEPG